MIWIFVLFCSSLAEFKFLSEFYTRHGEIDALFKKLDPLDLINYDTSSVLYLTKDEIQSNKYEIVKFGPFQMACEHDVKANPKLIEKEKLALDFLIRLFATQQLFSCIEIQSLSKSKVAALCAGKSLKILVHKANSDDILANSYSYDSNLTEIRSEQVKTFYVNSDKQYSSVEYNCSRSSEYVLEKFTDNNFLIKIWHPAFCAKPKIDDLINSSNKFILKFSLKNQETAYYSFRSRQLFLIASQDEVDREVLDIVSVRSMPAAAEPKKSIDSVFGEFLNNVKMTDASELCNNDAEYYKIEKIPFRLLSKYTSFGNFHRAIESLGVRTKLDATGKYKHIDIWQYCPTNYGKSMFPEVRSKIISNDSIEVLISNPVLCVMKQLREERETDKLVRFSSCKRVRYKYDHSKSNLARDVPKSFTNDDLYKYNLLPANFIEQKVFSP